MHLVVRPIGPAYHPVRYKRPWIELQPTLALSLDGGCSNESRSISTGSQPASCGTFRARPGSGSHIEEETSSSFRIESGATLLEGHGCGGQVGRSEPVQLLDRLASPLGVGARHLG